MVRKEPETGDHHARPAGNDLLPALAPRAGHRCRHDAEVAAAAAVGSNVEEVAPMVDLILVIFLAGGHQLPVPGRIGRGQVSPLIGRMGARSEKEVLAAAGPRDPNSEKLVLL